MRDVVDQLAAYAEVLDRAAPDLEELAVLERRPSRLRFGWRPGVAAAAAAVLVVVVIGGLAFLARGTTPSTVPPANTSSTTARLPVPSLEVDLVNPQAVTPLMFSAWEHAFAGPGGVAVVDGSFHMLSSAYGDGVATVAYAQSSDGIVWTQGSLQPVLDLAAAPWAPLEFDHALARSVIVDAAGNWQLYFEIAWLDRATDDFRTNIGRAVAPDPGGPWLFDELPILRPDPEVAWMAKRVGSPSVVATDDGLAMLFVGYGEAGGVVGLARSAGGGDWEVRPTPVLAATQEWERGEISRVDLIGLDTGFIAIYGGDTASRRGLAVSTDLIEWVPHPENPFLTTAEVPRASMFDSEFVADADGLVAFVENGGVRSEREVAVLRISVDLERLVTTLTNR